VCSSCCLVCGGGVFFAVCFARVHPQMSPKSAYLTDVLLFMSAFGRGIKNQVPSLTFFLLCVVSCLSLSGVHPVGISLGSALDFLFFSSVPHDLHDQRRHAPLF